NLRTTLEWTMPNCRTRICGLLNGILSRICYDLILLKPLSRRGLKPEILSNLF
ncbi:hypothetical protein KI387_005270, partial [Taxus chinensis]